MKFLLYLIRWQLSTPILALCLYFLNFSTLVNTIIANFIGACIFFWVDKCIFKGKNNITDEEYEIILAMRELRRDVKKAKERGDLNYD